MAESSEKTYNEAGSEHPISLMTDNGRTNVGAARGLPFSLNPAGRGRSDRRGSSALASIKVKVTGRGKAPFEEIP